MVVIGSLLSFIACLCEWLLRKLEKRLFSIPVEALGQDGAGEDSSAHSFGFAADSSVSAHHPSSSTSNTIGVSGDGLIACRYYALECGIHPGVYASWTACEVEVKGFRGAKFKAF